MWFCLDSLLGWLFVPMWQCFLLSILEWHVTFVARAFFFMFGRPVSTRIALGKRVLEEWTKPQVAAKPWRWKAPMLDTPNSWGSGGFLKAKSSARLEPKVCSAWSARLSCPAHRWHLHLRFLVAAKKQLCGWGWWRRRRWWRWCWYHSFKSLLPFGSGSKPRYPGEHLKNL